jgi:hypothetical protein
MSADKGWNVTNFIYCGVCLYFLEHPTGNLFPFFLLIGNSVLIFGFPWQPEKQKQHSKEKAGNFYLLTFFFFFAVLGMKPRALGVLSLCSSIEFYPYF